MRIDGVSYLVFMALALTVAVVVVETLPPPPLSAEAPLTQFSAARAIQYIQAIAKEPHPTGSEANRAVREYILDELQKLGLETETQRDGDFENVIGRITGSQSSDAVLLTAHLDSAGESNGATDDGSGVAVLLETARALRSDTRLRNTVIFLFTDNEEGGLIGAKAFIADHPWAKDVKVVIGFDAGGLTGPGVLSATSRENGWLIRHLVQADRYFVGSSAITTFASSGTDFGYAFKPAGFSGYAFDLYWDRRIHTPDDTIQNVNLPSLQHQGYHALFLTRHFGNLIPFLDSKEPDRVYFTVLRGFTVSYSSTWALPLAMAVTAVFWGVLAFGLLRRTVTWRGMTYGMFVLLVGILIAPLPGLLIGHWGTSVPIRYYGRLFDKPTQVLIITFLSIALISAWYSISLRIKRVRLTDITMGALFPLWVGMVGASTAVPTLSFVLSWPLLFSLFGCANWFHWYGQRKNSQAIVFGMLAWGVAGILILGPTILLGLFDQMPLTLLLVGVLCGFLSPQLHLILGCPVGEFSETARA